MSLERDEGDMGIVRTLRNGVGKGDAGDGDLWEYMPSGCVGCIEIWSERVKLKILLPVQSTGGVLCECSLHLWFQASHKHQQHAKLQTLPL